MQSTLDFTHPLTLLTTTLFIFLGVFGRYVVTALLFNFLFKKVLREQYIDREVQIRPRRTRQDWTEIGWSCLTSLIFATAASCMLILWQKGYTRLYLDWETYPYGWFLGSILLVLFLHETYYYWVHRWMHQPGIYRLVHKIHHDSITTSAWTSFSFHPLESTLQAIFIPIIVFLLPIHAYALGIILTIMTITSAINHLNTEIYPQDFTRHWFGRWWIGATHHSLHHSQFRYNYGLYFTFWDKWMHTESPEFVGLFDKKTGKTKNHSPEKGKVKVH